MELCGVWSRRRQLKSCSKVCQDQLDIKHLTTCKAVCVGPLFLSQWCWNLSRGTAEPRPALPVESLAWIVAQQKPQLQEQSERRTRCSTVKSSNSGPCGHCRCSQRCPSTEWGGRRYMGYNKPLECKWVDLVACSSWWTSCPECHCVQYATDITVCFYHLNAKCFDIIQ